MQEKINVDALIESFETSKSHIRSISKLSQAKLKALTAEEWNARIEENQNFIAAEWKVILSVFYGFKTVVVSFRGKCNILWCTILWRQK